MMHRWWCAPVLAVLGQPVLAQGVGSRVPEIELDDFSQTPAESFDDYQGRAVLIEFFAYT